MGSLGLETAGLIPITAHIQTWQTVDVTGTEYSKQVFMQLLVYGFATV